MAKIQLIKSITTWYEEAKELQNQELAAHQFGHATFTEGKLQAFREVLNLLYDIKNFEINYEV